MPPAPDFGPPVVDDVGGFRVVRDDLVPGGTKRRVVPLLLGEPDEYVYASPAQGYAQLAIALACAAAGKRATIFVAQRAKYAPLTEQAAAAGATICEVPLGFLSNVQAKADRYAAQNNARLLPFGLNSPRVRTGIAAVARSLPFVPDEVWTVAGSGMLARALQEAWPRAEFHVVKVGKDDIQLGAAETYRAPEKFHQDAKFPPPFPSCVTYDAKAWRFMLDRASPGALFWNVGS